MGTVNISLTSGGLGGTLQTNDGVAGLVLTGAIDGYTLGTPYLFTGLTSALQAGLTQASSPFAYKQIKEFYDEAGDGAQLYAMMVSNTVTLAMMTDRTNVDGAKKLLDYANGKIRMLGFITSDTDVYGEDLTVISGMNDDVRTAKDNALALANEYFGKQKPFRALIGGTSYQGVPGNLDDQTEDSNNRVAIVIGDTVEGEGSAVGLTLGRLAAQPVMRKISRVRTGKLIMLAAYLGGERLEDVPYDPSIISPKGYITFLQYANMAGYFYSGDDTCSPTTDDYHFLARGRVIDKAHILAYTTFVQEVDDEVPINKDGTLDAAFCTWLSQQIINQINNNMTANAEISSVSCTIDPAQNILSTNKLKVVLKIIPVGYATDIEIQLGFENPANA